MIHRINRISNQKKKYGVKPVRITEIRPIKGLTEEKRKGWLAEVRKRGELLG